jgi:mevalonate kinase
MGCGDPPDLLPVPSLKPMPSTTAAAPGKIILFGEHAAVYGRPAVAVPLKEVQARAVVKPEPRFPAGQIRLAAPDINLESLLEDLPQDNPLGAAVHQVMDAFKLGRAPACSIRITSTIPIASGLGSGAAVSVAVIRAFSSFLGRPLSDDQVCALAFEVEKLHHGTPSGIDNAVITYAKPIYFVKDRLPELFSIPRPFTLVIGDTGIPSPTAISVGDVRKAWKVNKDYYEALFDSAGAIADSARQMLSIGMTEALGPLLDANHGILKKMGMSSAELDALVDAARKAGASGAKLSGGGRGGNMIALSSPEAAPAVAKALEKAGAKRTLIAKISG